jgi:acyl-CoA reductase-like NAD-dependent aldehyde dehydrogenase
MEGSFNRRSTMRIIDTIYVNGEFVAPHGREPLVLADPATERDTTTVILADEVDARRAIAAAKAALPSLHAQHARAAHGLAAAPVGGGGGRRSRTSSRS